jgi:predicted Zn-dependent protease
MQQVRVRKVGFGKQMGFELAWEESTGSVAVHVLEADAVRQLQSLPQFTNSTQIRELALQSRRGAATRSLGWLLLAIFVLLPVILIGVFLWHADRIAGAIAEQIPISHEISLGQQAFEGMRSSLTLIESGPAYDAVTTLGRRLAQGSKYPYQFHLARDESINAFAMPGGIIVVHTGLIAATQRPEQLAGVMAHEIQHIEQRHSLRGAFKELGLRGLWALVTGDIGSTLIGQATLELTSLRFSRSDESSADAVGLAEMAEHGIDPRGMVEFFATMEKHSGAKPPAFLSTHPADNERQEALAKQLNALPQRTYAPLSLGHWPPVAP